jgi:hypothetical protein
MPAMYENENIHINGTVSEKLVFNLYRIQKVLQILVPSLCMVNVTFEKTTSQKHPSQYIASGFSGGVDAYTTLYDYFYHCDLKDHKLTHLTYHNVGNHIIGDYNTDTDLQKKLFEKRYHNLKKVTKKIGISGLSLIKIDSNLDDFYVSKKLHLEQTNTLRNVSVALLLQKGFKRFYVSSGYSYENINLKEYSSTTMVDPVLLPLLSTESLETTLVGAEYSRIEKTLKIATLEDAQTSLDVCIDSEDETNCSKCYKCMRTQFTLDLAGKLKDFSSVFDMEIYESHKKEYIEKLILDITPPYSSEILDYARKLDANYGSIDVKALIEAADAKNALLDEYFDTDKILKKAKYYQYNKDLKNAMNLYKLILLIDPDHSVANHYLELLQQVNRI